MTPRGWSSSAEPPTAPPSTTCARACRADWATRCCRPRCTWATTRLAVLLGDDLVDVTTPVLPKMIEVRERFGGSVLALMEVPPEAISAYGCAAVEPTEMDGVVRVTGLVEKPGGRGGPSTLAVIGRYVLAPEIFGCCTPPPLAAVARSNSPMPSPRSSTPTNRRRHARRGVLGLRMTPATNCPT